MPEGLSPAEVGKEIAEHKKHSEDAGNHHDQHDRRLSIVEAVLLSFVAVLAAYSGYAAAKWGTESSVTLATAAAQRTKANRADTEAIVTRTLDSASFNAWFSAFIAGDANAQYFLGNMYQTGRGVTKNDTEAVKWFSKAAEQGHTGGQYFLAGMYEKGIGVREDKGEAVNWYRKAARQGHPLAQKALQRLNLSW